MNATIAGMFFGFMAGVLLTTLWAASMVNGGGLTGLAFIVTIICVIGSLFYLVPIIIDGLKDNKPE
jgi:hypothetical protein